MTTQVSFKTDQGLKDAVFKKLKNDGVSLKALMNYAMKAYLDKKIVLEFSLRSEPRSDYDIVFDEAQDPKKLLAAFDE